MTEPEPDAASPHDESLLGEMERLRQLYYSACLRITQMEGVLADAEDSYIAEAKRADQAQASATEAKVRLKDQIEY